METQEGAQEKQFLELPNEIQTEIFKRMTCCQRTNFSKACKEFAKISTRCRAAPINLVNIPKRTFSEVRIIATSKLAVLESVTALLTEGNVTTKFVVYTTAMRDQVGDVRAHTTEEMNGKREICHTEFGNNLYAVILERLEEFGLHKCLIDKFYIETGASCVTLFVMMRRFMATNRNRVISFSMNTNSYSNILYNQKLERFISEVHADNVELRTSGRGLCFFIFPDELANRCRFYCTKGVTLEVFSHFVEQWPMSTESTPHIVFQNTLKLSLNKLKERFLRTADLVDDSNRDHFEIRRNTDGKRLIVRSDLPKRMVELIPVV